MEKTTQTMFYIRIIMYILIFLNSISGIQIGGISINSIINLLFILAFFIVFICNRKNTIMIPMKSSFVLFLIFSIVSCLFSYFSYYYLPHESIVIRYAISSFFYLIMYIALYNVTNECKIEMVDIFKKALIYTARIHVIWGIAQIVFLYAFGININQWLFMNVLHTSNNNFWTVGFFSNNEFIVRITGFNYENAMFAIVVCIGMALEDNKIWKKIMTAVVVLSLSRTGWLMVLAYYCKKFVERIGTKRKKIDKHKLLKTYLIYLISILLIILAYSLNPIFQKQVNGIVNRIRDNDSNAISANRHMLYYPLGMYVLFNRANIKEVLFGYGMRCSGLAFTENLDLLSQLGGTQNYTAAFALECDVMGLLLGGGIITFICYYLTVYNILKTKSKFADVIWIIFIGGITYHFHSISYIIYVFMIALIYIQIEKNGLAKGEETINELDN